MTIEFIQYLMPYGRRAKTEIDMPEEIEILAAEFVSRGGCFESEMLGDYETISLTACMEVDGEDQDIAIEICKNGPPVVEAVARLVRKAAAYKAPADG